MDQVGSWSGCSDIVGDPDSRGGVGNDSVPAFRLPSTTASAMRVLRSALSRIS